MIILCILIYMILDIRGGKMSKEEQLMKEIKNMYYEQFNKETEMIKKGKITDEEEASKYTKEFHTRLFQYIEKRKEELGIK